MEAGEAAEEEAGRCGPARTGTAPAPEAGPGRWPGWRGEAGPVWGSGGTFGLEYERIIITVSHRSERFRNHNHNIMLFSSTFQVEDLLRGEPDQQVEVGVEMFPPEAEDPAPLLGWEVRTLNAV